MIRFGRYAKTVILCAFLAHGPLVQAQAVGQSGAEQSTAILSTEILFAIGAREAEQAIRGSFGWPTFQEGFVEGVYFRFDPDGYARFSPSPRLDEDVFEVICAPASTACVAKKSVLQVGLTTAGQAQVLVEGITPIDSFFISDRLSELPLPPTILEPLDPRLEALLSGGGDLVVKREVETVQSVSLVGFSAVVTYLRWVSQRQSPRVFPRGWPVPAQSQSQTTVGLTQPNQWVSPNAGPQANNTTWRSQAGNQNSTLVQNDVANQRFQAGGILQNANTQPVGLNAQFNQGGPVNARSSGQIQQLQQQLQLLQNQLLLQQSSNSVQANGNGYLRNPQPDSLVDFGQSFAQQAQGRSMPETPGGLGVGGSAGLSQSQASPDMTTGVFGQPFPQPVYQTPVAASGGVEIQALSHRMSLLEQSFLDYRRDVSIRMNRLQKDVQTLGFQPPPQNRSVRNLQSATPVFDPVAGVQQTQSGQIARADTAATILNELEKTLLQRLDRQNQAGQGVSAISSNPAGNASVNRQMIEDILGKLSAQTATEEPRAEAVISDPSASGATGENDFVTLSDYINQVLKTEGLQVRDPGR